MVIQQTLLWMFADSALPTGGYIASQGLESAFQSGRVQMVEDLQAFVESQMHHYTFAILPYMKQVYSCCEQNSNSTKLIMALDQSLDTTLCTNHVARRASMAQGVAYLSLMTRSFPDNPLSNTIDEFKNAIRQRTLQLIYMLDQSPGHHIICLSLACFAMNISLGIHYPYRLCSHLENARHLALFQLARSILSASVRLNIIGPFAMQSILCELGDQMDALLKLPVSNPVQTSPIVEILQARHDRLYSRLFNS